jgi:hypothetical protein
LQPRTHSCQKSSFGNAAVVHVARSSASVGSATGANPIAARPVVNEHGSNRGVQPIVGIREPFVVGKRIGSANETTGYGEPRFA